MRQVSQTVGIVTLFLLMLPHALRSENNSLDGQQLKRNVEKSMHHMAKNLEQGLPINQAETKRISKAFNNLTIKGQSKLDKMVFNIKSNDDAHIRLSNDKNKTTTDQKFYGEVFTC
ncbi:uncharacterized protein LOC110186811 isoform X2 [Drosophila serrata]|uniref:uncharacterized protein LOC110186811 isoform X2 n=1 Tax=Drosophila serrata TaxID=7274 RepID=UPI000A1D2B2D|nr:uncharacterized protein LOC110186811 isoform X2 [Drosophila serrata]